MRLLFVALLLLPQDEKRIAQWIRELGDDSIEVREKAMAELLRAGREAEKALREAARSQGGEIRDRALQVLADLEKAEKLRQFDAGASRITLKREGAPLGEVLRDIQKQTATKLAFSSAPEEDRVTVSFDRTPLFQAIDALCKANGRISYAVECRRDDNVAVTVSEGKFVEYPRAFQDQYVVRLDSIQMMSTYDLQGGVTTRTRFDFRWGWEKGTRPQSAAIRIEEIVDDLGNSYAQDIPADRMEFVVGSSYVGTQQVVEMPRVPTDAASRFAVIKGALEVLLPETMLSFTFASPEEKAGATQRQGEVSLKLLSCARDRTRVRARVEVRPLQPEARFEIRAVDKEGKEYAGRYNRRVEHAEAATVDVEITVPERAELEALRLAAPWGAREKKVPFEFRDLRFR